MARLSHGDLSRSKEIDMVLVCPKCQVRYRITENEMTQERFLAKCSRCGHIFTAFKPQRVREIHFLDLESAKKTPADQRVIAVSNQKGGVAKTTTCLNLGVALTSKNNRVLLIDLDGQANLSAFLGHSATRSFYEAVEAPEQPLTDFICSTLVPELFLLPSSKSLVLLNKKYLGAQGFEYILKDRLTEIVKEFDFIVVDTPPSIGFFTLNALTAAGLALIPSTCDVFALHGVNRILDLTGVIRKNTNPNLEPRILVTLLDPNAVSSKVIFDRMIRMHGDKLMNSVINLDPKIQEAQIMRQPMVHYDKQSVSGRQYASLAAEVIQKNLSVTAAKNGWGGFKN